jgi:ribose transport system permease protein
MKGVNPLLAIVITLLAGLLVGSINAFIVVRLNVNAFIGTLAMTAVLHAIGYWITGSQDVTTGFSQTFLDVGRYRVPFFGVSSAVLFMLGMAIVLFYFLERVPLGRYIYATGANPQAAKLSGIRSDRVMAGSFLVSALLATIVGIVYVAQVGTASLEAGPPYLLPAFSAVFLGATQIVPGRFNVIGTLVAVYLLATGVKGLQLTVAAPWVNDLFVGGALIIAVALAERGRRQSA